MSSTSTTSTPGAPPAPSTKPAALAPSPLARALERGKQAVEQVRQATAGAMERMADETGGTPMPGAEPLPPPPPPVPVEVRRSLPAGLALGDLVLVLVEAGVRRPMIITSAGMTDITEGFTATGPATSRREFRLSGTIFCEPEDHTMPAFRDGVRVPYGDPARVHGRPDRFSPFGFGEALAEGMAIGQWIRRPTTLPTGA